MVWFRNIGSADIYISPTGDDSGAGTEDDPYASLGQAIDDLNAMSDPSGTIVFARGGTYTESNSTRYTLSVAGSASSRVRIEAYPGESPVFDVSGVGNGANEAALRCDNCEYLTLDGLEFHSSSAYAVRHTGAAIGTRTWNCVFHSNSRTGLGYYLDDAAATDNEALHCESYDNDSGNGNADGFAVNWNSTGGQAVAFRYCVAHNNEDDGFDFFYGDGDFCEYCYVYETGRSTGGTVYGTGDENGFKLGGDQRGPIHAYKCVARECEGTGFTNNTQLDGELFHLVAYNNGSHGIDLFGPDTLTHTVRNCLSHANAGDNWNPDGTSEDDQFNSWNLGITEVDADYRSTTPADWSIWGKDGDYLRLGTNSAAMDAGTDVGYASTGSGVDVGAFERGLDDEDPNP